MRIYFFETKENHLYFFSMCAQYTLKAKAQEIFNQLKMTSPASTKNWDLRVQGFLKTELAPVVLFKDNQIQIKEMAFSLCPSWSLEYPCKWSTYNARMERPSDKNPSKSEFIYEIPTWRDSFNSGKTCLVPMTGAIESSYFGSQAGNIIQFKTENDELFFAAGIYSEWTNKETGEIKESFTLITDDPYPFFYECGHDRSIFIIDESQQINWLINKKFTPKERFDFLRKNRVSLNWSVEVDRPMAKGWEKRKPSEQEIQSIRVFKEEKSSPPTAKSHPDHKDPFLA